MRAPEQYLDHHLTAKRALLGEEDARHAATAELALHAVGAAQGLFEEFTERVRLAFAFRTRHT